MADPSALVTAFLWYIVFLFTVTIHEASHALAAKLGGDLTAYHGGQVSIDPIPHIRREPFGMVIFPIISLLTMGWPFGFASTPIDMEWMRRHPGRSAIVAACGPLSHFLLLIVAVGVVWIGRAQGFFDLPTDSLSASHLIAGTGDGRIATGLADVLSMFIFLNFILMCFNMIPFPPLDGSGVVMILMSKEMAVKYLEFTRQPMVSIIGLLMAWRAFGYVFDFAFPLFLKVLYPDASFR